MLFSMVKSDRVTAPELKKCLHIGVRLLSSFSLLVKKNYISGVSQIHFISLIKQIKLHV